MRSRSRRRGRYRRECELCGEKTHTQSFCPNAKFSGKSIIVRTILTFLALILLAGSVTIYIKGVDKKYCDTCSKSDVDYGKKLVIGSYIYIIIVNVIGFVGVVLTAYRYWTMRDTYHGLITYSALGNENEVIRYLSYMPIIALLYTLSLLITIIVTIAYSLLEHDNLEMLGRRADIGILTALHVQHFITFYLFWFNCLFITKVEDVESQKDYSSSSSS